MIYQINLGIKICLDILFWMDKDKVIKDFSKLYYESRVWSETKWMGVLILKCPMDLITYEEIIFEKKPDIVLETGTAEGGSAFYMAHLMDIIGHGEIVTVDILASEFRPQHNRITYLTGSSIEENIITEMKKRAEGKTVMVILDSDHSKNHVFEEMKLYSEIVSPGQYMIVEDSNINGHPVYETFGPGPMEAIEDFMKENNEFTIDKSREKLFITFNPSGYLLKK